MARARGTRGNGLRIETLQSVEWNRPRLLGLLRSGVGRKILVIGDVGVDRYTIGSVERISPEAPVPIVFVDHEMLKLGLAANVADNVKALGGVPWLLGVVGEDRGAQDFRQLLGKAGIERRHLLVDGGRRTVLKERIVSESQQLLRVDYETPAPLRPEMESRLGKRIGALIAKADAVILEDYAKGLLTERVARMVLTAARRHRKVVAVDPNAKTPAVFYRGATVLTPNTREAESLSGLQIRDDSTLAKAGLAILKSTAAKHVVITRGKEGMAIFTSGERRIRMIPTYAREVYDVSGAGDTVISVLTLALASGATIEEAALLGNLAAGVEVGKRGTATVSPEEIRAAMDHPETLRK